MSVITRGEREISARFDTFPQRAHAKLQERITALTTQLQERVQAATPVRTGLLKSEIKLSIYGSSDQNRVAGYVSVYAGGNNREYPKAATLEYGSNKARKLGERLNASGRLERRISRIPHIEAFRYLRGPFEAMKPEIQAALEEAMAETIAEDE